jgi:hypothetical protein
MLARYLSRAALSLGLLLSLTLLAGCPSGAKKFKVTGKMTKGGQPLAVRPVIGRVRIQFDPVDSTHKDQIGKVDAVVKEDGTFSVFGSDNKGLPAGKYKIYVYQYEEFPKNDLLKGAFGEGNSPLVREVTGNNDHFEIDLDKPS